jgi:hypothetical protein
MHEDRNDCLNSAFWSEAIERKHGGGVTPLSGYPPGVEIPLAISLDLPWLLDPSHTPF